MKQLSLSLTFDEVSLKTGLEKRTGNKIILTITDNSCSMISMKKKDAVVRMRLHRIFLSAGTGVIDEMGRFIKNTRISTPLIRQYIRENSGALPVRPLKRQAIVTIGKYHDLNGIAEGVNSEYFGDRISAGITWGARNTRYEVRRRTLGSYSIRTNMIRINPVLDKKTVPLYFIEFIVYHEMLHADVGVIDKNGRRSVHSREFRRRERLFRDFEKVLQWEKKG